MGKNHQLALQTQPVQKELVLRAATRPVWSSSQDNKVSEGELW